MDKISLIEKNTLNLKGEDPNKKESSPNLKSKKKSKDKDIEKGNDKIQDNNQKVDPENKDNKEDSSKKVESTKQSNSPSNTTSPTPPKKSSAAKWIWITIFILLFVIMMVAILSPSYKVLNPLDYTSSNTIFAQLGLDAGTKFNEYNYGNGYGIVITFEKGKDYYMLEFNSIADWQNFMIDNGILAENVIRQSTSPGILYIIFIQWMPWIIILGGTYWIMKKAMQSQGQIGNMKKGSMMPQMSSIKFEDVAGYEEVKAELWEIVDFLKNPIKYNDVGARTPKGVLLSGPPGTGKTFLAKAVAGQAEIPFYSISGSDFVEMFVGVGAKRVRELFNQAKVTAPSLIFIDELDAVGRQRGAGVGGGHDEREQTLNQMLVEMDGFSANSGVVVMAATNRPDVLDPALKRPGRFDRSIEFRLPDIIERQSILEIYAKQGNKVWSKDINWKNIAGRTPGFSAAELENVINEAAILSVRLKRKEISLSIIDEAIDRVIGGPSKSNNLISDEEKRLIAYHEAGHALIGLSLEHAEKVQKITIIPRGGAGGYVLMTPKKESFVLTKSELKAKLTSYMAGRASEEFFFGKDEVTTGASSDIEEATKIARRMVVEFGMSELGPVQYEKPEGSVFLGRDYGSNKLHSSRLAHDIDIQVRTLIDSSYEEAYKIINKNKDIMTLLANALLIKETLTAEEAEYIFQNKKLPEQIEKMKNNSSIANKPMPKVKTVVKPKTTTKPKTPTKK